MVNNSKKRKLIELKEKTIVRYIFELDLRAFFFRQSGIKDIVNRLFYERNALRVGKT